MNKDIDISEIRWIIRNLIAFIAVEGKDYVSEAKKKEYVSAYVHVLIKTIYLMDEKQEFSIIEDIAEDIANYLE
ncbi:hypothetical protein [Aquimarina muelleri]|uniref:Uncharacterized protein n=1 Tax=Aquimarina muelleri TaxID=279356 RepID=A0A918N2L3_9FLAO|nr:hypothetical protein [Aquimarina muelleri]MCX2762667.1 hypothetical protein [Aquimarina muelleri]GGX05637.1 hypothetical protein GCM10007384_04170 [Aquimarina muelleri]